MARLGDDAATRTAKVLSLPTRAAILSLLLRTGPKTVREIADRFGIHPNVARAHLDLMAETGFLMTETRRRDKGRPAKVYFTWEGEAGALSEAGVDDAEQAEHDALDEFVTIRRDALDDLQSEARALERTLDDAGRQLSRLQDLIERQRRHNAEGHNAEGEE